MRSRMDRLRDPMAPPRVSGRRLRAPGRIQLSVKRARIAHTRHGPAAEPDDLKKGHRNVLNITFPQVVTWYASWCRRGCGRFAARFFRSGWPAGEGQRWMG